jgi:hypothetical protein
LTTPPEPAFFEGSVTCLYCGGEAEPEQDSDVIFFACKDCGGEFGYRRPVQAAPVCAAGLTIVADPAQPPGVVTLESGSDRRSVFLGDVIKRRPE